jgi:hypothetical protein
MIMASLPNNKNAWLRRLKKSSIPIFAKSIKKLSSQQSLSTFSASGLAKIILKDPGITTSILKLANSVHYNPSVTSVRTISRAVTLLGFDTIKEIMTSCLLIETYLGESANNTLRYLLAKAFHTAYQAKEIAKLRGENAIEEIFINALILNIGELSLVASLPVDSDIYNKVTQFYPLNGGQEKDLIGCNYFELSLDLFKSWGIAPMLNELLNGNYVESSASRSVLVANSFAQDYELNGMEAALNKHEKSLTAFTKKSSNELRKQLCFATKTTQACIHEYGLTLKTDMAIKKPKTTRNKPSQENKKTEYKSSFIELSGPGRKLLLDVIFDLTRLTQYKFDFNIAMHLLLEGLSRSAQFDTSVIALFDSTHTHLIAKYEINNSSSDSASRFDFDLVNDIPLIEKQVIIGKKYVEASQYDLLEKSNLADKQNRYLVRSLWAPLIINNKVVGCIYASNSTKDINQSQKSVFKLLSNQSKSLFSNIS